MTLLQHDRITTLCAELRLTAMPDLYGAIAQGSAKTKDATFVDFLEEVLRAERDARRVRAREMLTRTAGFPAMKTRDRGSESPGPGTCLAQLRRTRREYRAARARARRIWRSLTV